jgi:hypothetical protein
MFSGLTLAPQMRHVSQELLEPCAMSKLMSSSTLNPLASASSLTLLAVPSLTVREYHPLSGMNDLQQRTAYIFDRSITWDDLYEKLDTPPSRRT